MAIHATLQWSRQMFEGLFRMPSHVWSVGGIILLGQVLFGELRLELNIKSRGPTATSVFFKPIKSLKPKSKNHDNG